jgi:hypothetical protein
LTPVDQPRRNKAFSDEVETQHDDPAENECGGKIFRPVSFRIAVFRRGAVTGNFRI